MDTHTPAQNADLGQDSEEAQASSPEVKTPDYEQMLKDQEAKYLYLYAEFENFKKRSIKERSDLAKFGSESFAREMILVLDNLERALSHLDPSHQELGQGLKMVYKQFLDSFQKQGVLPIEAIGKPFDPNLHEAMGREPSNLPQGHVTKDLLKGYTLHGRLLRPSKVTISQGEKAS